MSLFVSDFDNFCMSLALSLANEAADKGEVPVGAVIVKGDKIIATGRNRRETIGNALAHAEIEAINSACNALGSWRLNGCKMYVTLEPCPMCAGAIVNARLDEVVFGALDPKAGSCGSLFDLFELPYNHHPLKRSGVMGEQCAAQLSDFFSKLR